MMKLMFVYLLIAALAGTALTEDAIKADFCDADMVGRDSILRTLEQYCKNEVIRLKCLFLNILQTRIDFRLNKKNSRSCKVKLFKIIFNFGKNFCIAKCEEHF